MKTMPKSNVKKNSDSGGSDKMETNKRVRIAFRKLKAHVYFDKTALPLRDKVVEFEASDDFEKKLTEIEYAYDNALLGKDSPLMEEILDSINTLPFPKKMYQSNKGEASVISIGKPNEAPVVENLQYFIDMDVRGHIIGILWIMAFGKRLENLCFANSRGNRLRNLLIWNDKDNNEILDSPALFEPYFAQYSLWRDEGLSCAEGLLAKKHDALIVTLDLKRYYYRTGITKDVFNNILAIDEINKNKALHESLFLILERYSEILKYNSVDIKGIALPIGFLPSAVLSNWCLSKFDKGILDYWNPAYYGRYVDDIIIVDKIEKNSELYRRARKGELTKGLVLEYYLGNGRRNIAPCFAYKKRDGFLEVPPTQKTEQIIDETEDDDIYQVYTEFCLSEDSLYEFESSKTRIIALFADNNSKALINKFKEELYENVSEFRLMPDIGEAFSQDDFSEFYRLENDATINKLRGVNNILIDKYELSKFLGRYRVVSSLVDENKKRFTETVERMFNDSELIEYYILWERIFEIFITDKDFNGFSKFVKKVITAINCIEMKGDGIPTEPIKKSLLIHLTATLNRVLSLLWGETAKEIQESLYENGIDTQLRNSYFSTRMINKYILALPVEILSCPTDKSSINMTSFKDVFGFINSNEEKRIVQYRYLPYFRQAQDIATAKFFSSICHGGDRPLKMNKPYIDEIKSDVGEAPISQKSICENKKTLITIGSSKTERLKIAIANVSVSGVWNLENALQGRPFNRKYTRYKALSELMNSAIKNDANMIIMPENYVPIEWLPAMAAKAARENIAIITGIEHIIINNEHKRVYNYTAVILPFRYFETIPTSAVFYQLKKHYSPEEKRLIEGYGFEAITEAEDRAIFRWQDCYFPVYCCYELASINDRAEFISWADMVVAVEHNKDTNYFGSIVESLTHDLHCYCVQVNTSEYGDSRITQPTKHEAQNILTVKGGSNPTLLIGEVDIKSLREFQIKNYTLQRNGAFKPTPPGLEIGIVRGKIEHAFD